jgi:hypothetical protein
LEKIYYHYTETGIVNGVRDHIQNGVLARTDLGLHGC